jgi:hypothetical protein
MRFLVLRAYLRLLQFDLYLARRDFSALRDKVRNYPVSPRADSSDALTRICSAMNKACIWYWKEALCLQRSAAMTCLLKRHGVAAQLIIAAQQMPFRAHAWVEVDGQVINDKPNTAEMYGVLEKW